MHLEGERRFDLLITDLMLPGAPGEEVVAAARARHVPVIVLSARATVADRVDLLRLGADDYLVKPFDLEELAARCEAVLRRVGGGGASGAGGDGGDADFGNRTSASASDRAAGPPAASRASDGIACGTGSDAASQSPDECLRFGSWMLDEGARAFTVAAGDAGAPHAHGVRHPARAHGRPAPGAHQARPVRALPAAMRRPWRTRPSPPTSATSAPSCVATGTDRLHRDRLGRRLQTARRDLRPLRDFRNVEILAFLAISKNY